MPPFTSYNDQQLVAMLQAGDEQAFRSIYDRYWKPMLAMAFLRLKRREMAEDIVQDIFTTLWQNKERLNIHSLESWLATAVKYKVITLVNRQLKKEIAAETIPDIPFFDTTTDARFLQQQFQEEMNQLPDKCRIVFHYSREMGFSNQEIARALDISEKAVEKHITKARKSFAATLRHLLQTFFSFL